jgi:dipeptidyl aminopeptidase/acylaminoacyl peptidase
MMKLHINIFVVFSICFCTNVTYAQIQPKKIDLISEGNKLNAEIFVSQGDQLKPTLILMHGYPGGEGDLLGLGESLSMLGINVLVFNYQGSWSSQGEFSFENSMKDAGSAIKFLKQNINVKRFKVDTSDIVVGGYSFGGAMALTAAIYNPEIKRIISIAGADESVFGRKMSANRDFHVAFEEMLSSFLYPDGPIKCDLASHNTFWLSNLERYDQVLHAESLRDRDILLIGGWNDINVEIEEHILPLYRKLQELNTKKLEIIALNTDHSFKYMREELKEVIYKWIVGKE